MTTTQTTSHLPLKPGRWALDDAHSTVGFTIRHLGVAKVRGRFTRFTADVVVGDTPESSRLNATVELASVDTGQPDRDAHIRRDDMVDVERRPTMTFRSSSITGEGSTWTVAGELTIGDVSKPFTLDVELGGIADYPLGGPRHAGVAARGALRRRDYAIAPGFPPPILGDLVEVELDLELLEPED